MTTYDVGRWLLVGFAILGLALLAPVVGAHGTGPTAADAPPYNATAQAWATWMEAQMFDHVVPGSDEWMEAHVGVTVDEMARDVTDVGPGAHGMYGQGSGDHVPGGMYARGGGC